LNPVIDGVVGGWELNTINTAHTGTPLNVYYTPATANAVSGLSNDYRGEPFLRPNVSASGTQSTSTINNFFGAYTFSTPAASAPFGNLGRKTFRIRDTARLQFRSEFFNLPNHTNFGIPNTNYGSSSFGTIRSTYPARQIQFALKAIF